jgi:hypothetical protein
VIVHLEVTLVATVREWFCLQIAMHALLTLEHRLHVLDTYPGTEQDFKAMNVQCIKETT